MKKNRMYLNIGRRLCSLMLTATVLLYTVPLNYSGSTIYAEDLSKVSDETDIKTDLKPLSGDTEISGDSDLIGSDVTSNEIISISSKSENVENIEVGNKGELKTINSEGRYIIVKDASVGNNVISDRIRVEADAEIYVEDIHMKNGIGPAIEVVNGKTLTLIISGTNVFDVSDSSGYAGIQLTDSANLIIKDKAGTNSGVLDVKGGADAAAIGSAHMGKSGDILIESGWIKAYGGKNGAGLGTGYGFSDDENGASVGNITINEGKVEAQGGSFSSGIGGGNHGTQVKSINIINGEIDAKGGQNAPGIGTGYKNSKVENIIISGGKIKAEAEVGTLFLQGGASAIGCGLGNGSETGDIKIVGNAVVTAIGSKDFSGIGEGNSDTQDGLKNKVGNIIIEGGTVKSTGIKPISKQPQNTHGENVYLLTLSTEFETSLLTVDGKDYKILGGHPDGGSNSSEVSPFLYLYLTAKDHLIESNEYKQKWDYAWNSNKEIFVLRTEPAHEIPSDLTGLYGQTLSSISLPYGWVWDSPDQAINVLGTQVFSATFIPEDKMNYYNISLYLTVNIKKGIPYYEVPTNLTAMHGQRLKDIPLPKGWKWENPDQLIDELGSVKFKAIFSPEDTEHYAKVLKSITVKVISPLSEISGTNIKSSGAHEELLSGGVPGRSSEYLQTGDNIDSIILKTTTLFTLSAGISLILKRKRRKRKY